jgi:hypothetical protein
MQSKRQLKAQCEVTEELSHRRCNQPVLFGVAIKCILQQKAAFVHFLKWKLLLGHHTLDNPVMVLAKATFVLFRRLFSTICQDVASKHGSVCQYLHIRTFICLFLIIAH